MRRSSTRCSRRTGGRGARAAALLAALALAGCGAALPDVETDPGGAEAPSAEATPESSDSSRALDGSLVRHRNGTIRTAFDTYIVRDISFDSGEGLSSAQGLLGFANGTLWEYKIRFIRSIEVLGKVSAAEARSAPSNYFVRDEQELRRTFRTRLEKTDGEIVDFIVRINGIGGTLEAGGPLLLSRDELETLRRIEFF